MGYLRTVRGARLETIILRTHKRESDVRKRLAALENVGAIVEEGGVFRLVHEWRDILPEIVAVEVKVSDWRRATRQAARNRVFAHRVYVALPEAVATRVKGEPEFATKGIGVVAIHPDGTSRVARPARRESPLVWAYYYGLALIIGGRKGTIDRAVRSPS